MKQPHSWNRSLFVLLCAACLLAIVLFGIVAQRRSRPALAEDPKETPAAVSSPAGLADVGRTPNEVGSAPVAAKPSRLLYFRANTLGNDYGRLAVAPVDALERRTYSEDLHCDRVHFAGGRGVCLASDRGVFTTFSAIAFDDQLRPGWTIQLDGEPSRTRVSPGGRLAAITVFRSGHSYASLDFSTETTVIDNQSGKVLLELEQLSVTRDGEAFQSPDFNFWGVTFTQEENRFYATLWSKGKTYLVESDLQSRRAKIIHEDVECPSLSPDNTRIAFKRKTGPITWRIWLLDLKTMAERPLGETRSVDDQVEWLDNDHVLYALPEDEKTSSASTNVWSLSTQPGEAQAPRLLLKGGFSPAAVSNSN